VSANSVASVAVAQPAGRVARRRISVPVVPAVSGFIVALLAVAAIFADVLAPHDPTLNSLIDSMNPPAFVQGGSREFLLGTDVFGRDILSRLIYGARISMSVAFCVLGLATAVGVSLGVIAGYFGGVVDALISRVIDITISFPPLLVAIVLAVVFGPSFTNVVLITTLFYWPLTARQVRGEVLALKHQDFVVLARVGGASNLRIMRKHILPSVLPTVLVITTLQVGAVIIFEASLSFLGVGVPPPQPSWGVMVADGRGQIATGWWLSLSPGLTIFTTVLATNALGDWLRDRIDPRLRQL
jgi:peptide/nickel transport system permease protein